MLNRTDDVNHPAHYNMGKIEVIEAIEDWKLNYHCGNAVKYIARAGKKVPDKSSPETQLNLTVKDLEKAIWYLRRDIERMKADFKGAECVKPNDMPQERALEAKSYGTQDRV